MTRREIRNCAFILIYEKLLRDDPIQNYMKQQMK